MELRVYIDVELRGRVPESLVEIVRLPGLGAKTARRLWHRRWFVAAYAMASTAVGYQRSFLGQAWQLLTPLLNILVYYLIFGLLLHTNRGIPNFIAFLSDDESRFAVSFKADHAVHDVHAGFF